MTLALDLTRSQFACASCKKDAYATSIFAKSEDGKILTCSKECFNSYRAISENRKSMKWYFCFPVSKEVIDVYIQVEKN